MSDAPQPHPQRPRDDDKASATAVAPLLSIITPVYNAQATVQRTIASYQHIAPEHRKLVQIVMVDDGSTDDSAALIDAFAADHTFGDVKVIHQPNGGTASARNTAIEAAQGTWLFFLDADDELAFDPTPYLAALGARQSDVSVLGFTVEFRKQGKAHRKWKVPRITRANHRRVFTGNCVVCTCSLVFKRDRIDEPFAGRFALLEDWHWWLVNPRIFDRMWVVSQTTSAIVHLHSGNKTSNFDVRGQCRVQIASELLDQWAGQLSITERHNLQLQEACGQLQMGKRIPLVNFVRFPCNWLLYVKFWVYFVLRRRVAKIEMYG